MDGATIKLHQNVIRHCKGLLTAYETWLGEQTVEAMTAQLKQERAARMPPEAVEKSVRNI